jgi:hypothetical protein
MNLCFGKGIQMNKDKNKCQETGAIANLNGCHTQSTRPFKYQHRKIKVFEMNDSKDSQN